MDANSPNAQACLLATPERSVLKLVKAWRTIMARYLFVYISLGTLLLLAPLTIAAQLQRQLGTVLSSRRYKEDIHDMRDASNGLLRLRPVTFRYKQPIKDGSKPLDYGLIAEEVGEVYPDLVVKNADGEVETIQYHKLTPMLLNELQKQHARFEEQRK
jgi:hypothetical protein